MLQPPCAAAPLRSSPDPVAATPISLRSDAPPPPHTGCDGGAGGSGYPCSPGNGSGSRGDRSCGRGAVHESALLRRSLVPGDGKMALAATDPTRRKPVRRVPWRRDLVSSESGLTHALQRSSRKLNFHLNKNLTHSWWLLVVFIGTWPEWQREEV